MTEPTTPGDQSPKVIAVEKQASGELLVTVARADGTRKYVLTAAPAGGVFVTGLLGAPGVPDDEPAETLPNPQDMSNDELLAEATVHNTRADEENPHA